MKRHWVVENINFIISNDKNHELDSIKFILSIQKMWKNQCVHCLVEGFPKAQRKAL